MRKMLLSAAVLTMAAAPAFAQPAPGPMDGPHGPWGPKGHEMMMHMMRHQEGDSFRFKRNDGEIDIHCSNQQPVQTCVQAAMMLMQQLKGMSQESGNGGTGSSSGTNGTGSGSNTTTTH